MIVKFRWNSNHKYIWQLSFFCCCDNCLIIGKMVGHFFGREAVNGSWFNYLYVKSVTFSHRHRIHRPRKRPKVVYQQLTQLGRTDSAVGKPLIYYCENSSSYSGRGAWSIYSMSMHFHPIIKPIPIHFKVKTDQINKLYLDHFQDSHKFVFG